MLDKNTSYTSYIFLILVNMSSAKISFFCEKFDFDFVWSEIWRKFAKINFANLFGKKRIQYFFESPLQSTTAGPFYRESRSKAHRGAQPSVNF